MIRPAMSAAAPPPADLRRTWPNIDTSPIHLPNEIIEEILSKSDVKSLVRFKSVSKSWQSVISRILESKLSENQNMFLFWAVPQNESDYGLYLTRLEKDGKFRREPLLGYPSGKPLPYAVCSCNGLVLLNINSYEGVMLWNPFIGKHITIPYFNAQDYPLYCHLYHDSTTNDHRIVFVNEDCYAEYSCKNKSWGKKKYCTHELIDDAISAMVALVDGCLYWLHYDGDEIMCFDSRDGKLHKLEVPNEVRGPLLELEEVSGRLCLYFWDEDGKLHLWVMEENRNVEKHWRKVMGMDKAEPNVLGFRPMCLSNEDDVVLCGSVLKDERSVEKHFIYRPRQNSSLREIHFDWNCTYTCLPYSASLYMPS